jgi:transposase InsO family protein
MCRVLDVSSSGYYAWRKRSSSPLEMANEMLLKEIQAAHQASKGVYGSPRIYHEVKAKVSCSQNRVARLMKKHGIAAKQKGRYKQTTRANGAHPVVPNLVDRDLAIRERKPAAGLIHHSDRGSQYTGAPYQELLKNLQFQVSMSGTGNCYDNAPTESFFGS